ncbi:BQ5605_C006g03981 [Microbotryum silenes-dioicae]|uniref:BQ5605_C006g03981 protein n=1 Tax=Microbotryum silenes-dioicae TaxID=796604 RepID=A0A2X0P831_9BASI|nr:BQ5605_C006g03981 [Microbotryum silenes-dioicae]
MLPTHAGSRAVLATHVAFRAFTALSTFPYQLLRLRSPPVGTEFHLAGRSQLLAARYETLDVACLE